ncbi:hypothetical protein [Microbaculum marinum]|uniref:Uncharacterized protein n=1 Tax=Microbaculum marinum TaxID=1764581 RepID=A0AAW9RME2_9HYPH
MTINFRLIGEDARLTEAEMWPRYRVAHPRILGSILDLAASVNRVLPSVSLGKKPRMADFALILAAVDEILGTNGLQVYVEKQNELATDSLTGDSFITAIAKMGPFTGTSAEILDWTIKPEKPPRDWPANARAVTQRLKRQAPVMRKAGWQVEHDDGRNHKNVAIWTITPRPGDARILSSQPSQPSQDGAKRESARNARHEYGPSPYDEHCHQCGDPLDADDILDVSDGERDATIHRRCEIAWSEAGR